MKASEWIDRVKAVTGWETDYRVAKGLGISRQALSDYRARNGTMDEETAVKVASVLHVDPAVILADQAGERSKSEVARTAWLTVVQKLGGVAASALMAVALLPTEYIRCAEVKQKKRRARASDSLASVGWPSVA